MSSESQQIFAHTEKKTKSFLSIIAWRSRTCHSLARYEYSIESFIIFSEFRHVAKRRRKKSEVKVVQLPQPAQCRWLSYSQQYFREFHRWSSRTQWVHAIKIELHIVFYGFSIDRTMVTSTIFVLSFFCARSLLTPKADRCLTMNIWLIWLIIHSRHVNTTRELKWKWLIWSCKIAEKFATRVAH